MMKYDRFKMVFFVIFIVFTASSCLADDKRKPVNKQKKPPLLVTTVEVQESDIQPMDEFVGTTSFARVSHVATDIEGLVLKINFEVGEKVKRGDQLVFLDSELLDSEIIGTRASFEQNLVDLESAERDLKRIDTLLKGQAVSEIDHDAYLTKKKRLEKLSVVLESKLNTLLIVKRKKIVLAPFDGIVLEKTAEVGEWLAKGGKTAVVADSNKIDILVNIAADLLEYLEKGRTVRVKLGSREVNGSFFTFIPVGDITTRTFTAKFRLKNPDGIVEGLEAIVLLPRSGKVSGLLVPRDAVVDKYGKTMVFIAVGKKAKMIPVQVAGYHGLQAVVNGPGLEKGQQVIVKGSKRVSEDLPITFKR